jgi:hypothetical protein
MKKIIALFVCVASFGAVSAQVSFGGKAGLNLSTFGGEDNDGAKMKPGFHVGAFADIPVSGAFSVQPEVFFSTQGAKFEEDGTDYKSNMGYINVPVLAKYSTASGFYALTGPQIGFLLSAKGKAEGESEDIKELFKKTDFSWALGVGYKFGNNIGVAARYNLGLSNIWDGEDGSLKNNVIQVGLTYSFGSK